MNNILDKYSAKELLEWLRHQDLDIYLKEKITENDDGETFISEVIDVDKIEDEYIKSVLRYTIIKRGKSLYIFDQEACREIMRLKFTPDDYEYVQNTAQNLIDSLNNRNITFVGKKHHCG